MRQEDKGIPFAGGVSFCDEERVHELWRIRNEVFEFAVDRIDGEDSVLAHI
jgi:hypothetical protein